MALPVRVPESLLNYVRERAGWKKVNGKWQKGGGELTRVIEDSLKLHQQLHGVLKEHKLRLQRVALDAGLDWQTQEAEVYGRMIIEGLEVAEKRRK